MNFYDLQIGDRYNERPILRDDKGGEFSKSDFLDLRERISEIIPARSLVFLFAENKISTVGAFIACLSLRIVPVMVDVSLSEELKENLIAIYKPQFLIADREFAGDYLKYRVEYLEDLKIISTGNKAYEIHKDLAMLLTTSGSTGSPKLVRQSYNNINANAESIAKYLELDEFERPITMLPFHYTYGISVVQSHLFAGATILVTDTSVMEKQFWKFLGEEKATSIVGVPYTYEMLNKLRIFERDMESVKTLTQAGGKLSLELHQKMAEYAERFDKRFFVMYGQAEATARMGYLPYERAGEKIGSMGIAIPGGKFELVKDGEIIEELETVGELIYYGDNVTMGYAESYLDLNKGDERRGRLETGDMAKRDADGFYYIVGRKKRFLKIFGSRLNLDELDGLLKSNFKDVEFASVGEDDRLTVFYAGVLEERDVEKYIEDVIRVPKWGFRLNKINEIPKNKSGKIMYKDLGV